MPNGALDLTGFSDVFTTAAAVGVTIAIGFWLLFNSYIHPLASYPGPKVACFTRLWYAFHLIRGTLLEELLKAHEKYGYVVRIAPDELSYDCPEAWNDIYESKVHPEMTRDPRFFQDAGGQGQSLLTVTHENHRAMRKKLAHGFSTKSLRDMESLRLSYADIFVQRLSENAGDSGSVMDLVKWYTVGLKNLTSDRKFYRQVWMTDNGQFFSYDIQSDLAFGKSLNCLETSSFHPWVQLLKEFDKVDPIFRAVTYFPWAARFMSYLTPRYLLEMNNKLTAMSTERAKDRMARPAGRSDFLEHVIQARDGMSEADICANAVALIGAGSDTTATLLSGTTYFLLKHPGNLKELTLQLRQRFQSESEIDQASVDSNELLQACIMETLRVYPPAAIGFTRVVPKPGATIVGRFVPEGTTVCIPQYVANHSAKNFSRPDEFCPTRWLESKDFEHDKKSVFRPFACGPYRCLGDKLALSNVSLILARVLWRFDLSLEPDCEDWKRQAVNITYIKKPLHVFIKERADSKN